MTQYEKMTQTPVSKLIVKLSIPTIASMLVTNLYNLVDTAFVGTIGNSASGAIGIVFGFMSILQAIGFMFGHGAGTIVSRRLGAKDISGANMIVSTGFFSALFLSFAAEVLCMCFMHPLVMLLGSTETIAPYAETYVFYIILAAPFMVTSYVLNNVLRYEGKALLGMIGLMSGAIVNICFDAVFIFGFHMGIMGAGLATAISQILSFCILISMFIRGKTESRIALRFCRFKIRILIDIMTSGVPSMLRQGLNSITTVLLNTQAAFYGDEAIAAMSIVSRIIFFTFSTVVGIGQGFQPICAFNYGAKKFQRVKKAYWMSIGISQVIVIGISIVLALKSADLVHIFRADMTVVEIGSRALTLYGLSQLLVPFTMITEMLFQSIGKKIPATILASCRGGFLFIPLLLILPAFRGLAGIQEAQPLANVLSIIPAILYSIRFFKRLPTEKEDIDAS